MVGRHRADKIDQSLDNVSDGQWFRVLLKRTRFLYAVFSLGKTVGKMTIYRCGDSRQQLIWLLPINYTVRCQCACGCEFSHLHKLLLDGSTFTFTHLSSKMFAFLFCVISISAYLQIYRTLVPPVYHTR